MVSLGLRLGLLLGIRFQFGKLLLRLKLGFSFLLPLGNQNLLLQLFLTLKFCIFALLLNLPPGNRKIMVALDLPVHLGVDPACCRLVTLESADAARVDPLVFQGISELSLNGSIHIGTVDEGSLPLQSAEPKLLRPVLPSVEFVLAHHELAVNYATAHRSELFDE